jgi:hypothetical protein
MMKRGKKIDFFKDWIVNEMNDANKMSLRQLMMLSEDGQVKLQRELKYDSTQFKQVQMKEFDDDALYVGRTVYTDSGMHINVRNDRVRHQRETDRVLGAKGNDVHEHLKEMVKHYNLKYNNKKGMDLKTLNAVYRESQERTPYMVGKRKKEQDLRQKKRDAGEGR